jgi:hypothetical protein
MHDSPRVRFLDSPNGAKQGRITEQKVVDLREIPSELIRIDNL